MVVLTVGGMTCRRDVRRLSACIADLDGVVSLEVELVSNTVRVEGDVSTEAVRVAVVAAGYEVR
jgi:copper chaperone CopZ